MPSELTSLRSMSHGECAQTTGTTPVLFDVDKLEWTSCNGHCQGLLTFVVLLRRAYVCHVRAYYKHPLRRGRSGTQPAKLVVIAQGLLKLAYIQGKGADTHCSSAIVLVLKALSGKYWICHYRFPAKHSLQTCHWMMHALSWQWHEKCAYIRPGSWSLTHGKQSLRVLRKPWVGEGLQFDGWSPGIAGPSWPWAGWLDVANLQFPCVKLEKGQLHEPTMHSMHGNWWHPWHRNNFPTEASTNHASVEGHGNNNMYYICFKDYWSYMFVICVVDTVFFHLYII